MVLPRSQRVYVMLVRAMLLMVLTQCQFLPLHESSHTCACVLDYIVIATPELFASTLNRRSMDWADTPLSRPVHKRATQVRRPSREHLVCQDGPLVLCVLLGTPHGRWQSEFTSPTRAALAARRLLSDALGVEDALHSVCHSPALLGMIVFQSWHVVSDTASRRHAW